MSRPGVASRRTALVAEDHEVYRLGLADLLQRRCGFQRVIQTGSLDEAIGIVGESAGVDFATFDLGMPGMHGASSLLGVRQACPNLVAVVVTASEQRSDILAALGAGAHGYMPKSLKLDDLVDAIESVLSGRIFLPWSLSNVPSESDREQEVPPTIPDRVLSRLTPRQHDILRFLRSRQSNKQIARELGLTENTVKAHTVALYRALGVRGRADVISDATLKT